MGNKVKYNLKNVHAAKLTKTEDGKYTYATPQPIPGAVSISLDAEGDSSPFYADGIVYFRSTANNGYSGDLEIALIPEWFRTDILKETLDKNGVLIESSKVTEMEKFALLFEFDGDVRCIRHVFITALLLVLLLSLKPRKILSNRVQRNFLLLLTLVKTALLRVEPVIPLAKQHTTIGTSRYIFLLNLPLLFKEESYA